MRVVIVLVLLVALASAQKRKDEPEYDDDYDYDNDEPVKDTKKDLKDSKTKASVATPPAASDSAKNDDQHAEKPAKKLDHPSSLFLKPRNTRVHNKVGSRDRWCTQNLLIEFNDVLWIARGRAA
ncbi:uncharacterized protein LOC100907779 [Galendromus occidentalis]|uniref:Uncharacterized protein LOC100907779 n=1 Tax=Galendromus occidentalis TaxID=34638 RepID=A0AAJ6VVU7_9ACAR|nr:uncharacterized protein LOC100907779 [Galendromus occidentalis]